MHLLYSSFFDRLCDLLNNGGGSQPVPEFDGPAGIAAAALLVSLAAVLYDKVKK